MAVTFCLHIVNIIIDCSKSGAHNGGDLVQNFLITFLMLCRELCLLTSTYL